MRHSTLGERSNIVPARPPSFEEDGMLSRIIVHGIVVLGFLGSAGVAVSQDQIRDHFHETALDVKATEDPTQKREILTRSLGDMTRAIGMAKSSTVSSASDDIELDRLQATLLERSDELAGVNGFDRVPDGELDAFSTYIVQDMEQAHTVTISVVTLLLIIIIIILIA
jgi:hypothetical protein